MITDNLENLDKRDVLIDNSIIDNIIIASNILLTDLSNKNERILLVE